MGWSQSVLMSSCVICKLVCPILKQKFKYNAVFSPILSYRVILSREKSSLNTEPYYTEQPGVEEKWERTPP